MSDRVYLFDTTLRDGEQSPGIVLNIREKLEIAEQLARLKVDVIEAGFPIASEGDFEAVREIARRVRGPIITALARTDDADIDRAWEAIRDAERPRIHTFVSTSDIHLQHQLKKTRAEALKMAHLAVRRAKGYVRDVEFSAMDATRSDPEYLCEVFAAAIEEGATVINVPDTVGYALPHEFEALIRQLIAGTPGMDEVIVSVHCHNDLGLAVANSTAAMDAGVRQVECAVNGIGERAGNASLEEIIMIIDTRKDLLGLACDAEPSEIARTSRLVSRLTGYPVQPNKAIVGANAFAHESGIHQDGVLKERSTYEIMNSERVGRVESDIVMGKHSGRHAFRAKLEELGFFLTSEGLDRAFKRFKELADAKGALGAFDLEALVLDELGRVHGQFTLEYSQSSGGTSARPVAAVRLAKDEKKYEAISSGNGQVDALCNAIKKAAHFQGRLVTYNVKAITGGLDALGDVTIKLEEDGRQVTGRAVGADIVGASGRAFLNAINRMRVGHDSGRARIRAESG
jgi:2-isopropylmalate synthase